MNITFITKTFEDITAKELYEILRLRSEVFVVEQDCVYQDIDNKDQKALHVIGYKNDKIIAYTRLFNAGDYFDIASIGRVVVAQKERKFGYGHDLIRYSITSLENHFKIKEIKISAQKHLQKFYASHGFYTIGKEYLEDGILHVTMIRKEG